MSKDLQMLKARESTKEILYNILDKEGYSSEERNAYTNLRSQILLETIHRFVKMVAPRSYQENRPGGLAGELQLQLWREFTEEYNHLIFAYDFFGARGLMLKHLEHINVEQFYDLRGLLVLFYESATRDSEVYNLEPGRNVTWLPEDMNFYPENCTGKGDNTKNG